MKKEVVVKLVAIDKLDPVAFTEYCSLIFVCSLFSVLWLEIFCLFSFLNFTSRFFFRIFLPFLILQEQMDLSKKGKISIDEFKKFFHHSHYDRLLILGFEEGLLSHLPKEDLIVTGSGTPIEP
jgi:hypothetical protein